MRGCLIISAVLLGLWSSLALGAPAPKSGKGKPPAKKPSTRPETTKKPAPNPEPLVLGGVTCLVPGDWTVQPAGGQFRVAQYALPKASGDTAQTLLIVFHFGKGGGGTVEDNVKRWMGMMRQPEGTDVMKVTKRQLIEREGLRITTVDIPGTYLERPFPMSDEFKERPNYRMLAAIVDTTKEEGDGPYYLRIVGPAKTVEAAKPGWDALIASLKTP
jgi:hypothetical protein